MGLAKRTRIGIIGALLIALIWRAFIPAGFMPKSGALLTLEICHGGLPAPSPHSGHRGDTAHIEHCLFAGMAAAPLPQSDAATTLAAPDERTIPRQATNDFPVTLVHVPEPRGPPARC